MKRNDINIADLTQEIIDELNESLERRKLDKRFTVEISKSTAPLNVSGTIVNKEKGGKITKTKPTRTLTLHIVDLKTRERRVLYKVIHTPKNSADLLSKRYITYLYAKFFSECLTFTCINIENIDAEQRAIQQAKQAEINARQLGINKGEPKITLEQ